MSVPIRWLIAAVVCVVIEILPPATHFAFLAFAVGALAASMASAFFQASWVPWATFVVISLALMPMLIPLAKFLFARKAADAATPLAGERTTVVEPISESVAGVVTLGGDEWRATSESGPMDKGEIAEVIRVDGDHLVVRKAGI